MKNEIILGDNKPGGVCTMWCGALASKALCDKAMRVQVDGLIKIVLNNFSTNRAWVYEYLNGEFVLRAGAKTKEKAHRYMSANRILVYSDRVQS